MFSFLDPLGIGDMIYTAVNGSGPGGGAAPHASPHKAAAPAVSLPNSNPDEPWSFMKDHHDMQAPPQMQMQAKVPEQPTTGYWSYANGSPQWNPGNMAGPNGGNRI